MDIQCLIWAEPHFHQCEYPSSFLSIYFFCRISTFCSSSLLLILQVCSDAFVFYPMFWSIFSWMVPWEKVCQALFLFAFFKNFFFFYPRNHSLIIDQAIWTLIIASLGKKIQPLFMLDASESPNWAIILEPWNWRRLLMGEIHLRKYILIQSTFFAVKIASQGWQNPNIFVALPGEHDSHK